MTKIILIAMGLLVGAPFVSVLAQDQPPFHACIGNAGINCLRGADTVFHGLDLFKIAGVDGCRTEPSADRRMLELFSQGYEFEVVGPNEFVYSPPSSSLMSKM